MGLLPVVYPRCGDMSGLRPHISIFVTVEEGAAPDWRWTRHDSMKIAICVKRVPDTATKLKVAADGKRLETADIEYVVSPFDEIAVEHALRLKEKKPGIEVIVVSLGPAEAEKVMRTCLAMGADRGILLETAKDINDPFITAQALASALTAEKPDIILFGIKAGDDDNAAVGAITSSLLGTPFIEGAIDLELGDTFIKAKAETEGGHQKLQASFPCAISINKSDFQPRIASLINIRKAKQKELKKVPTTLQAPTFEVEKMELPPERKGGRIIGKGVDAVPELFRLLKEEAKVL